jgi:hypothetical protein
MTNCSLQPANRVGGHPMRKLVIIAILLMPQTLLLDDSPRDHSKYWNSFSQEQKEAYLIGVRDGLETGVFNTVQLFEEQSGKKLISDATAKPLLDIILLDLDPEVLSKIMTSLYQDPANSYVNLDDMIFIANSKLKGRPIDDSLRTARDSALKRHKMLQEAKQKANK